MTINVAKLNKELLAAGIQISGCNSFGKVWAVDNTEIQTRADVAVIIAAHDPNPSAVELEATARKAGAKTVAQSANGWFTWTPAQALDWVQTNIGTPLADGRTNLPATLTLASARAAFMVFLNILDKMLVMQIAMAKMLIAFRDDKWSEQ